MNQKELLLRSFVAAVLILKHCFCAVEDGILAPIDDRCGHHVWADGLFNCANGRCVASSDVCNSFSECGDYSDELGCGRCGGSEFRCTGGPCVPLLALCNGSNECGDNSDEFGCGLCGPKQFRCFHGNREHCIPYGSACDGKQDCLDDSDEVNCDSSWTMSRSGEAACIVIGMMLVLLAIGAGAMGLDAVRKKWRNSKHKKRHSNRKRKNKSIIAETNL